MNVTAFKGRQQMEHGDTAVILTRPIPEPMTEPALRPYPSKLFVEVTTRCNLHCPMCVKEARGQRIVEGHLTRETFSRLTPALPRLEALVLNGIGEPLLHPALESFIADARRAMPTGGRIAFQTNGQLLTRERAVDLARAGVDQICISADAVSPALFSELRVGARQDAIEQAAAALHEARRASGRPISVGVEFVAMRENLGQLPKLVRWAARRRFEFVIATHMLPYAPEMADSAAFDVLSDLASQVYRACKARTDAAGLDIRTCFAAFRKARVLRPSAADERLVQHVQSMLAQAGEEDVYINVERLAALDESRLRRTKEVFAEAEEVARHEGIELRLPAAQPSRARRCHFVEEGGAFVSWDGDLHPCHFLWHSYTCHVGGYAKAVKSLRFGNVGAEDVLAIWNGTAARAFRENVLRYDYPFCYDCNVALCNYADDEDFEQDCFVRQVPCGSCLWPTGVFHCLR